MTLPSLPWYSKLERIVAPTETATTIGLLLIIAITLMILWKGKAVAKAAWLVYLVSP